MAVAPIRSALILDRRRSSSPPAAGGRRRRAGASPPRSAHRSGIALDWTPNTNHTGLYVAQQEGWFARGRAGRASSCPTTTPRRTPSSRSGAAEFGISFQDSFTFSKAAGADITSVMAIAAALGLADRGARRPGRHHLARATSTARSTAGSAPRTRSRRCSAVIQRRGRRRAVPHRRARHGGLRGALRRAGRLHRAVRGLGGHRGRAARAAAARPSPTPTTASRTPTTCC